MSLARERGAGLASIPMLRHCRSCARQVDESAAVCPACGLRWPGRTEAELKRVNLEMALVCLVLAALFFGFLYWMFAG